MLLYFLLQVCIEKLQDLQLALVISRLYESEFETASTYKKILQRHVLGQDKQVHYLCPAFSSGYSVLFDTSILLMRLYDYLLFFSDSSPPGPVPTQHGSLGPGGLQRSLRHSTGAAGNRLQLRVHGEQM